MIPLPRAKEKQLKALHTRQGRKKSDAFVCEGLRCCQDAIKHRPGIIRYAVVSDSCKDHPVPDHMKTYQVSDRQFEDLAQTDSPQGILLLCQRPPPPLYLGAKDPFILVFDRVQTPGNMGSMLRTAVGIGLRKAVCTAGTVDPWSPKCIRAGMGAQFVLDIETGSSLEDIVQRYQGLGYTTPWLTVPRGGVDAFSEAFDLRQSLLIMGNEANGVDFFQGASQVTIPMDPRLESLNVAQAATILMYQYTARHGLIS